MIKIENVITPNAEIMDFVIEGMRNAFNSWDLSDSETYMWQHETAQGYPITASTYILGPNDKGLAEKLALGGPTHAKYRRMMPVYARITAPLYWWKEFDTYKVGTVSNSCSTMHKIHAKEFEFSDFSFEHLFDDCAYISDKEQDLALSSSVFRMLLHNLNVSREKYLETKDKKYWWQMIQLLPSSYNQTRNIMMNYEVLNNIYHTRQGHRLDEWNEFCKWIESLIYAKELIVHGEE